MWAFFMAMGPNFEENLSIEPFEDIHIFPLAAHILQLPDPPIRPNGTLCTLQNILKNVS
ncbi:ectonucleotide pyrophosphatase/phosphodiesterase family member 3-like [Homalodisca vitripennis]|uniref:ectonucleotide pyrophosphatase/phosphodiesterase family member 3-like n=1 Tax=Homalodisca vitripennis TaxID=197043 RepID=UPI001EEB40DE|nr:ectonucleotide pyrophosphatase/phosphodiesterase family member 3-like [Homalodisca vitripennis]